MIDDLSGIGLHTDEPLTEKLRITAEEVFDAEEEGCMDDLDGVTVSGLLTAARNEIIALRAIIEGRSTPPTGAEIEEHHRAGGTWYVASTHGRALTTTRGDAIALCGHLATNGNPATWWAIDTRRRPCAWPVVGGAR